MDKSLLVSKDALIEKTNNVLLENFYFDNYLPVLVDTNFLY